VVLAGASGLKRSPAHFNDLSFEYTEKSVAGWTPTPGNINELAEMIRLMCDQGTMAFVFNIFGNIGLRYEQFDAITALPFKSQGCFHLGGKIVTCPADLFRKTIESTAPSLGQ
jgi:hypothetical protein